MYDTGNRDFETCSIPTEAKNEGNTPSRKSITCHDTTGLDLTVGETAVTVDDEKAKFVVLGSVDKEILSHKDETGSLLDESSDTAFETVNDKNDELETSETFSAEVMYDSGVDKESMVLTAEEIKDGSHEDDMEFSITDEDRVIEEAEVINDRKCAKISELCINKDHDLFQSHEIRKHTQENVELSCALLGDSYDGVVDESVSEPSALSGSKTSDIALGIKCEHSETMVNCVQSNKNAKTNKRADAVGIANNNDQSNETTSLTEHVYSCCRLKTVYDKTYETCTCSNSVVFSVAQETSIDKLIEQLTESAINDAIMELRNEHATLSKNMRDDNNDHSNSNTMSSSVTVGRSIHDEHEEEVTELFTDISEIGNSESELAEEANGSSKTTGLNTSVEQLIDKMVQDITQSGIICAIRELSCEIEGSNNDYATESIVTNDETFLPGLVETYLDKLVKNVIEFSTTNAAVRELRHELDNCKNTEDITDLPYPAAVSLSIKTSNAELPEEFAESGIIKDKRVLRNAELPEEFAESGIIKDKRDLRNAELPEEFAESGTLNDRRDLRNTQLSEEFAVSGIINDMRDLRNELVNMKLDNLDEDLGLVMLFKENIGAGSKKGVPKLSERSKAARKRKKQMQKLSTLANNKCSSRYASSFKDLAVERDVESSLTCAVCLELYYLPHKCSPCGHLFCDPCLRRLTGQGSEAVPCPLCRAVIMSCVFDMELSHLIKLTHSDIYTPRAVSERRSKFRHYLLPYTPPIPLRKRFLRRLVASRNNQSSTSWMPLDWFKFLLGCTAGVCISLLIMLFNGVRSVHNARDVNIMFLSFLVGALLTFIVFKVCKT